MSNTQKEEEIKMWVVWSKEEEKMLFPTLPLFLTRKDAQEYIDGFFPFEHNYRKARKLFMPLKVKVTPSGKVKAHLKSSQLKLLDAVSEMATNHYKNNHSHNKRYG